MWRLSSSPLRIGWLLLVWVGSLFSATPADAHKVNVFAYADGATIQGEVYVRGGDPVRGATITVFDPSGAELGTALTDDEGEFTLEARFRCDHRVVADAGGGHAAEYTVPAGELPDGLPARGEPPEERPDPQAAPTPPEEDPTAAPDRAPLHAELQSLNTQIIQLRRQLDQYQAKIRLQDILGAIGYIVGVMGLAFYFLGVRRKEQAAGNNPPDRP
jgi:nickel transport protein